MSSQYSIQSTAGAVPVRNEKGKYILLYMNLYKKSGSFHRFFIFQVKFQCKK